MVYACLGVACHLHFGQNDRGLLRATAVTRGWNGHRIRVSTQSYFGEDNSPADPAGIRTRNLSITRPPCVVAITALLPREHVALNTVG